MFKTFIAALGTETNSFSSMPTGMATFEETMLYYGDATQHPPGTFSLPLHRWKAAAEARGGAVVESVAAFAQPAGLTVRRVYEGLRDRLLSDLKAALPVDIVLVSMHGAMTADGYLDCEGDLLAHIRALVGPDTVIGGELDLHCSLTDQMIANADVLVTFKEYPHVDVGDRADELFEICWNARAKTIAPVMAVQECRMVDMWRTPFEPMKSFVAEMQAAERDEAGVLSVSFAHCFPWQDVPENGAKMLVVADGDAALAQSVAARFQQRLWSLREQTHRPPIPMAEALDALAAATAQPMVLADVADNAGGGAPSDSTYLLKEMIDRGVSGVISGFYWDPVAVRFCEEAGEGARFQLRVGGKCGPRSGLPVDMTVTVNKIVHDGWQYFGESITPMGTVVWLSTESGIDLVLTTKRTQAFHPNGFEQLGIDLQSYKAIIVKSIQHFYAGFAPIASEVLFVAANGEIPPTYAEIPYQNFKTPYWPKVADPFA